LKRQQRAQNEDQAAGDTLLHALLQFDNNNCLWVSDTQIQTSRAGSVGINNDRVRAGDRKRLSGKIKGAAARKSGSQISAVRFSQRDGHTVKRTAGNSHRHLLARGPTESETRNLPRRCQAHVDGRSVNRERAGSIGDVVESYRRRARRARVRIDQDCVSTSDGERLRFDKDAAAATERAGLRRTIRLENRERPATGKSCTSVETDSLAHRSVEGQARVLTGRRQ